MSNPGPFAYNKAGPFWLLHLQLGNSPLREVLPCHSPICLARLSSHSARIVSLVSGTVLVYLIFHFRPTNRSEILG